MKNKPKGMWNLKKWIGSLSLSAKIALVVSMAGFLPVGCVLLVSLIEIQSQKSEQQYYALNQGYEQVYQALDEKMTNVHNISTLLAVSDFSGIQSVLSEDGQDISERLVGFAKTNSYSYGMEMAFDSCNIYFYIEDSHPVVNDVSGRFRSLSSIEETEWYKELKENAGAPTWIYYAGDKNKGNSSMAIARILWNASDFDEPVGVLVVSLDREALTGVMVGATPYQTFYMETESGQQISTVTLEVSEENKKYDVRREEIGNTGVYLVSVVPLEMMGKENRTTVLQLSIIFLLICVLVLLVLFPIIRSLTKRLKLLQSQMEQNVDGSIRKIEIEEESFDEVGQLIRKYNEMADQVEESMKIQYALGEEKKEAELKALQSQINPHFLYNTLDMINWMAQKKEMDNIREVVQAMSKFYRLTLSRGHDTVSIGDEIKMCDAYMEIQRRRYKGRINYEVEVEEEVLQYLIPKITLQPFLENAIVHGINEKDEARGIIILNGWIEDGRITLSVTDDGTGMSQDQQQKGKGSHYGMKNIQKRLQLFYEEEIPILIESSPGIGTCIIINIPMKEKKEGAEE